MIERVIHEGFDAVKPVSEISQNIAQAVEDWRDNNEVNMAAACNGPCCGGYYGDGNM